MSNMFQKRRMILAKKMAPNAICLVESGLLKMRNNDVAYTFRPNSSFYYLTGYKNPKKLSRYIRDQHFSIRQKGHSPWNIVSARKGINRKGDFICFNYTGIKILSESKNR